MSKLFKLHKELRSAQYGRLDYNSNGLRQEVGFGLGNAFLAIVVAEPNGTTTVVPLGKVEQVAMSGIPGEEGSVDYYFPRRDGVGTQDKVQRIARPPSAPFPPAAKIALA